MAFVEGDRVACHKATHDLAEWRKTCAQQEMEVLCEAQYYVKRHLLTPRLPFISCHLFSNLPHIIPGFWKGLEATVRHRASAMEEVF